MDLTLSVWGSTRTRLWYLLVLSPISLPFFWCHKGINEKFLRWERIGDATPYLFSAATAIYNPFSGYFEAVAVMSEDYVHRTWQRNDEVWAGWRVMGKKV